MSDDLFWPPVSGDGDGPERPPTGPEAGDGEPTTALPSQAHDGPETAVGRRTGTALVAAATAFVFGAGGVAVGAAIEHGNSDDSTPTTTEGPAVAASASALTTNPRSYAAIATKVLPSVVSINVTASNQSDTGSGVVLSSDGYVLTNNHVVSAAANGGLVAVTFNDGSTVSAKIVGTDSLDDLAVIKASKTGLKPATLGDSSAIQVGDPVLAVGSPLGLSGTVTSGIVSAINRPVETQDQSQQQIDPFGLGNGQDQTTNPTVIDAIQTDAAINPGNSGGALVDSSGEVIGINSAIASLGSSALGSSQSGNIGVGFAIPINQAKTISNELIKTGQASHPLLGVSLQDQTGSNGVDRAIVHSVTSGGPAEKAGIKEGDVITAIDGAQTEGADAVIAAIRSHQPGQRVTVTFQRGGGSHTVTATLAAQPTSKQG
jgi:putative serine protease PepD